MIVKGKKENKKKATKEIRQKRYKTTEKWRKNKKKGVTKKTAK